MKASRERQRGRETEAVLTFLDGMLDQVALVQVELTVWPGENRGVRTCVDVILLKPDRRLPG